MKKFNYPTEKDHLAMHDDLVKKALDYKRRFDAGEAIGVDLVNFVRDWLKTHHILKTDRALAIFVNQASRSDSQLNHANSHKNSKPHKNA